MEQLTCSACGAAIAPNTTEPYLICEYCDTAVVNQYYTEPVVKPAEEAPMMAVEREAAEETAGEEAAEESSSSKPGLLQTLLTMGAKTLLSIPFQRNTTVVRRAPATVRQAPPRQPMHRHHTPMTPARPGAGHAYGGRMGMKGPGGPGGRVGPGGRGGRGGHGGPGGRR